MRDIDIIKQLLEGNRLEANELGRAFELVRNLRSLVTRQEITYIRVSRSSKKGEYNLLDVNGEVIDTIKVENKAIAIRIFTDMVTAGIYE